MAKSPTTTTAQTGGIAPFGLRMLPDLRSRLEEAARTSGRSMNAEIVNRLESSFENSGTAGNLITLSMDEFDEVVKKASDKSRDTAEMRLLQELAEERKSNAKVVGVMSTTLANMVLNASSLLSEEQRKLHPEIGVWEAVARGVTGGRGVAVFEALELLSSSRDHDPIQVMVRGEPKSIPRSPLNLTGAVISLEDGVKVQKIQEIALDAAALSVQRGAFENTNPWKARGFGLESLDVAQESRIRFLWKLSIADNTTRDGDASLIYKEIEDLARMDGSDSTIWLNILGDEIPDSVLIATKSLVGFGVGLVVTHKGKSTLSNPESFTPELMTAIKQAMRGGLVWCPIAQKLMHAPHGVV